MPIKTLNQHSLEGVPLIGRLRKGGEKRLNAKQQAIYGKELDHFRVTFEPEYAQLAGPFTVLYGSQPKSIAPVRLLAGATVDEVLDYWFEDYNQREVLVRRCDGEQQVKWLQADGTYSYAARPCAQDCGCSQRARFKVFLPEFAAATGVVGCFLVQTGSLNDIKALRGSLALAQTLYGDLRSVYWTLARVERAIDSPEIGKDGQPTGRRRNITHHLLDLQPTPEFVKYQLAQTSFALPSGAEAAEEEAPDEQSKPAQVDWTRVYTTLKRLPHFAGVGQHVRNAINEMVRDGELARDADTDTIIAVVLAKYGEDAQAAPGSEAPDPDDLDAYLSDTVETEHEIPL